MLSVEAGLSSVRMCRCECGGGGVGARNVFGKQTGLPSQMEEAVC